MIQFPRVGRNWVSYQLTLCTLFLITANEIQIFQEQIINDVSLTHQSPSENSWYTMMEINTRHISLRLR